MPDWNAPLEDWIKFYSPENYRQVGIDREVPVHKFLVDLKERIELSTWRTMDTAPRDGTMFLAHSVINGNTRVVGYTPDAGGEFDAMWTDVGAMPAGASCAWNLNFFTHWMPLPDVSVLTESHRDDALPV